MTKPQASNAGDRLSESEKELADVRSETVNDSADTETTEPSEGDTSAQANAGEASDPALSRESEPYKNSEDAEPVKAGRRTRWSRVLVYVVLPGLALLLAVTAGFLKWQDVSARHSQVAGIEAVAAAKDATIALLSYKPDSAEKDLNAGRDRLTGTFKDSYTQLTHDVVIPGAKEKHISSVATVPAAASVSATGNHAVVVLFVNQTTVVGTDAPTDTESSVRVTLDKVGNQWLVSGFEPI